MTLTSYQLWVKLSLGQYRVSSDISDQNSRSGYWSTSKRLELKRSQEAGSQMLVRKVFSSLQVSKCKGRHYQNVQQQKHDTGGSFVQIGTVQAFII